jgi:hypothetical protein
MRNKLFGAILAPISIIGLTFALGIGATAFGTTPTGELQQSDDDTLISTLNVTTQVEVAPWCGWYVSTSGVTALALEPDASLTPPAPTEYIGTEIALTATAAENTAYVGPNDGLTEKSASTDCSWFTEANKYGARYDVVAGGDKFTAKALTGAEGTLDPGMDFFAIVDNELKITNVGISSCTSEGFATNETAELKTGTLTTTPWTVAGAGVLNNNFCKWSAKYEIKIPLGMSPLYGNVDYLWTGPTLTHTLIIPEDQGPTTP